MGYFPYCICNYLDKYLMLYLCNIYQIFQVRFPGVDNCDPKGKMDNKK